MIRNNKMSIEAVLFSIYVALTPANMILVTSNGSTVNKYIGLSVIIVICVKKLIKGEEIELDSIRNILPLIVWFCLSYLWSINRNETIKSIVTIINYMLLWVLVSERKWNQSEKKLIMYLSLAVGIYISYILISSQLSGTRRSTLVMEESGKFADQNGLASWMAFLTMFAINLFFSTQQKSIKTIMLGLSLLFLVSILATGSRGAFIGFFIGFMYYIFFNKQIYQSTSKWSKFAVLLGISLALYYLFSSDLIINSSTIKRYTDQELVFGTKASGRLELWEMYISIMNQYIYPYFAGFGFGTTYTAFRMEYVSWKYAIAAHNTYLYLLVSSGIVGLLLFIWFVGMNLKKCNENKDLLSKAIILIALVTMISLDQFTKKDIWNAFAFAQIGLGSKIVLDRGQQEHLQRRYKYIK